MISSCFENPAVTPSTMFATSVRVSPCSALCSVSSYGRSIITSLSFIDSFLAPGSERCSSPLGPFTVIFEPSSVTVTPFGIVTGFFPIRDIGGAPLPDQREQLAAGARLPRLPVGHEPLRRTENRHAEPVANARDLRHTDVLAKPRRGDATDLANHRLFAGVAQIEPQHLPSFRGLDRLHIPDVVVLQEDTGDLHFHFRRRNVHATVLRSAGVADSRQHVGDRIGHAHR